MSGLEYDFPVIYFLFHMNYVADGRKEIWDDLKEVTRLYYGTVNGHLWESEKRKF